MVLKWFLTLEKELWSEIMVIMFMRRYKIFRFPVLVLTKLDLERQFRGTRRGRETITILDDTFNFVDYFKL